MSDALALADDPEAFLDRDEPERPHTQTQQPLGNELHGFYHDMPYEEYAAVDALNASRVVPMRRSPMYYHHVLNNPQPETDAMRLGTLAHRMILEPNTVNNIAIWGREEWQKVRNGGKWDAFQRENAGKQILTAGDFDKAVSMSASALENAPIRKYAYLPGPTEVSMFWRHPRSGRPMKARIDKLISETHTIADLKTTRDSRPFRFSTQAHTLGYVVKMAHYWSGYQILTGIAPAIKLLAIESKLPCESVVFNVSRDTLLLGLEELENLIYRIEECEQSGKWPALETDEVELTLPAWACMESDTDFAIEV